MVGDVWAPPGGDFLLGTDNLGRDLLSRLIYGARTTIFVALAATLLSFSLGMVLGFTAAVTGGFLDQLLSRFNDLMMAIPTLIFALVVLAVLPQNLWILILVMAVLDSTRVFRLGRAVALDVAVMDFVEAARLRGEGTGWIIFREILPNTLPPLLAEFGLRFVFAFLFLSTLSFLGLGIQPPAADWGGMVKDNKDGIIFGISAALIPGAAIALLTICVNLVVDWLLKRTSSLQRRARRWLSSCRSATCSIEATSYPPGEPPRTVTLVDGVSFDLAEGPGARPDRRSRAPASRPSASPRSPTAAAARASSAARCCSNGQDILALGPAGVRGAARRQGLLRRAVGGGRLQPGAPARRPGDRGVAPPRHDDAARRRRSARCSSSRCWACPTPTPSASAIRTRSRAASCSGR